ncbi:MAG: glycosyltransferase family 4 protein [Ignavibacteriaceae bacterium]|nr:glycosyltransferase family 4 protein [Ignavibacteriaceae bacterium]
MNQKKKIFFLLSHPIQYFSPLFVEMAKNGNLYLTVLYCDDYGTRSSNIHPEVGEIAGWDIPMLEGYNYKFLKNNSWKPSIFNGFFGLINFEIFNALKNERGSLVVIPGWNYCSYILSLGCAKIFGLKICVRGDNPYKQEILKSKTILFIKRIILGKILFRLIDYFLYVGKENKLFYEYYGVPQSKLIFTPHAVDNARFTAEYEKYKDKKPELRKELGIPIDKTIILFSGQFIPKKRPMDLLQAYQLLNSANTALVFLGDGELRNEIENYIFKNKLKDVYLVGFKNQTEIGKYYVAADIFVLPSGAGETWGLVVNEAMIFALPVIVSNIVGSCEDLVIEDFNGYSYETGNIIELKSKLNSLINNSRLNEFGLNSQNLIKRNSFQNIIDGLKSL